ncbi:MAG: ankyrin repeat domain-containing protein [Limnohabitans sp.]
MKKLLHLVVGIQLIAFCMMAKAGSYDDFFVAVRFDNPSTVQSLLKRGFDPNTVYLDGTPALVKALEEKSYKVAEVLAGHPQIRPDLANNRDENALMLAALRGQEPVVSKLLARGAAVNKSGWTPLHYAATGGHARIAAVLIQAGSDLNAESSNGTTPLMMAAMYGNSDTVKWLLQSGADASLRNQQGLSAEDFANKGGRQDSVRALREHTAKLR